MKVDPILVEGAVVRGYRIVRQLGAGGMGAVFEAEETTIGRRVALKVLLAELAGDERNATRFEREAKSMSLVRHPSVIDVFAYGKLEDGRPYFVMPLLSGRSLREELSRRGQFTPTDAWSLMREVAAGLAAAHKAGVLHRDLKPENIFVASYDDGSERAILLDFGIAKWTEDASDPNAEAAPNLTATGAPIGTPVYMAPEQWWSQPCAAVTDQYAFGIVLFELLAGRPPFFSTKYPELLSAHLHEKPPSLRGINPDVGHAAETAIEKLLSKDGADRYPDMASAITSLDDAFGLSKPFESHRSLGARAEGGRGQPETGKAKELAEEISTANTIFAAPAAHTPATRKGGTGRYLLGVALSLSVFGFVGYGGEARHDVGGWLTMSGFGGPMAILLACIVMISSIVIGAGRQPTKPRRPVLLFGLALLPALSASLATWGGWVAVRRGVEAASPDAGFMILHQGRYENGCGDFIGLGLSSALFFGLLLRYAQRAEAPQGSATQLDEDRRAAWALRLIGLVLVASAFVLGFAGTASASFLVITTGAALVLLAGGLGGEERDAATAAAVGAVFAARGAAIGRADAQAASAWGPENTRAERAFAVTVADLDRSATNLAAWIVVVVFALLAAWLMFRSPRPSSRGRLAWFAVELGLLAAALAPQLLMERAFQDRRAAMARGLSEQFTLFSELSPPLAGDHPLSHPVIAPAIQVTRDRVAVNGREVSLLAALDSASGRQTIASAMIQVLARPTAFGAEGRHVDLSCTFDERLPWSRIEELLSIAHEGGAREIDLLFTRGATFELPAHAPPEAASVLPMDFAALPVSLDEAGQAPAADTAFGVVAAELLTGWNGEAPIKLRVHPRR